MERYSFYFTIPNRRECIMYSFHTNVTIQYFIDFLTDEMAYILPNHKIQIFEVYEESTKNVSYYLERSTLKEVFEHKWDKISFEIRFIE